MSSDRTKIGNPLLEKSFGKDPKPLNQLIDSKLAHIKTPSQKTQRTVG